MTIDELIAVLTYSMLHLAASTHHCAVYSNIAIVALTRCYNCTAKH